MSAVKLLLLVAVSIVIIRVVLQILWNRHVARERRMRRTINKMLDEMRAEDEIRRMSFEAERAILEAFNVALRRVTDPYIEHEVDA